MKFTCPACRKVHRVTVTITTPGEESKTVSSNTRSVTRSYPQIPKKYATGTFAPVVDIPIDANFILLDENSALQPGIDLDGAAETPREGDFFGDKTEAAGDRREERPTPPVPTLKEESAPPPFRKNGGLGDRAPESSGDERLAASEETAGDESPSPAVPEGRKLWDDAPDKPAGQPEQSRSAGLFSRSDVPGTTGAVPKDGDAWSAAAQERIATDSFQEQNPEEDEWRQSRLRHSTRIHRKENAAAKGALYVLVGAVFIALGYLGWQQYLFDANRRRISGLMEQADIARQKGEITAAAAAARDASAAVEEEKGFFTFGALWDRLANWTGLMSPRAPSGIETERKINDHLEREKSLESFKDGLDHSDPAAMGRSLAEARKGNDLHLALAMEKAVFHVSMDSLKAGEPDLAPETALSAQDRNREILSPLFSPPLRTEYLGELDAFARRQRERLADEIRLEFDAIRAVAGEDEALALARYRDVSDRIARARLPELSRLVPELAGDGDDEAMSQLSRLNQLVREGARWARSIYSRPENDESGINELTAKAAADTRPSEAMAAAAARMIEESRSEAEDLLRIRSEVFGRRQSEIRRGRDYPGTRIAWSMLRIGFDDPRVEIIPGEFRFDTVKAAMSFTMDGVPVTMEIGREDYEKRLRARVDGYSFTAGWAYLFHKPLTWMVRIAAEMRRAGVDPTAYPNWEILEGPGEPLALLTPAAVSSENALSSAKPIPRRVFFSGRLLPATETPPAGTDAREVAEEFRRAAMRLHEGIMADDAIPQSLRQALRPVLEGAYRPPDPRDYFDSAFCRRLIEANYLETSVNPLSNARRNELAVYRDALGRLEAGYDEFFVELDDGSRLYAVARLEDDAEGDGGGDQDPETGETLPRYTWRLEKQTETVFFSPLPARFGYAFMLAERYDGRTGIRPSGKPKLTEVWHATKGKIASYASGDARAAGDAELWNEAIAEDMSGSFDPTRGAPGWNFPLHVLERDDQGDPLTLATLSGVVKSPDFSAIADPADRRRAENEWLESTARTLSTPGELGLIFHQFFRYCSDSPLPDFPNLIGSHYGLQDTHQTVYESLERRWVGRLIGDCDDLAEFFQDLTRRQGKLSHVMQLPGHAACGYVEPTGEGEGRRFIILQTGPVLQFEAPSLNQAVELAYRAFDREDGISHMTTDAVPLLLRFADEETRTPFVLSARIYGDAEYAETMIRVQAYWHEHVYSAALGMMEEIVEKDQDVGNIKELGSLYERVGMYDKSESMRRRELEIVKDNAQASLSTLLELVQLHIQDKNREKALAALGEMETRMLEMIRKEDGPEFFNAMAFRSTWAIQLSRLGQPARAWNLIRYDVRMTKQQLGRIAEPVLRTLVIMYGHARMALNPAKTPTEAEEKALQDMKRELDEALGRGYFKSEDSYNAILGRYFVLGRYALADAGRKNGVDRLLGDGPYPDSPKDQTRRRGSLDDEDWKWLRITPQLYLATGLEMLDQDELPELYDPEGAKPLLAGVSRAVLKGTGLGSDIVGAEDVVNSEIVLSFLNRDLTAFRRALQVVKERNYASLYDESALTFGMLCGLIPLDQFPDWGNAFHEFYPGSQHYFKVVYRAIDKGHYDHALTMAEATARFFPRNVLLRQEAEFVRSIIPGLKERKANGGGTAGIPGAGEARPAA